MFLKGQLFVIPVSLALMSAGDQTWKGKQIAEWTEDDAKQVLSDSPWAKPVTPTLSSSRSDGVRRAGGGMGRGGGIGIGGIGLGIPGLGGMGRRGGMGGPRTGSGYPGGGQPGDSGNDRQGRNTEPPALTLRWESALPVRTAELKVHETGAPTLDDSHYAIAVYGLPRRAANGDSKALAGELKKDAALKRDGKKDLKPSSVQVLQREDGPVIVYLFPRSMEITRQDKRLLFDARIGRFQFTQSFYLDDMTYAGKLEL
jgi:hypothetical protein